MRLVLGLDRPTSGTATVGGRAYADARRTPARSRRPARRPGRRTARAPPATICAPSPRATASRCAGWTRSSRRPGIASVAAAPGEDVLPGHAPAARHRGRAARRPAGAAARRTVQRPRPRRHHLDPGADARARPRGPHRPRLQPPHERDRVLRRPPRRPRPGPAARRHARCGSSSTRACSPRVRVRTTDGRALWAALFADARHRGRRAARTDAGPCSDARVEDIGAPRLRRGRPRPRTRGGGRHAGAGLPAISTAAETEFAATPSPTSLRRPDHDVRTRTPRRVDQDPDAAVAASGRCAACLLATAALLRASPGSTTPRARTSTRCSRRSSVSTSDRSRRSPSARRPSSAEFQGGALRVSLAAVPDRRAVVRGQGCGDRGSRAGRRPGHRAR